VNHILFEREQALRFECRGETLFGILHQPAADIVDSAAITGVVVIVGGPQYRAGSHRQFVHLARMLAAAGHAVLRFDVRGMGDSTGALRNFEQITPDIGAAIDTLQRHAPRVRRVVLWGLCDGASAALLYQHDRNDPRVHGLCLLNPWVRSETSLARMHVKRYYLQRLGQRQFWAKLLRGQIGTRALRDLSANVQRAASTGEQPSPSFPERMADAWARFDGPVLLVLSEHDYTAKEFTERVESEARWQQLLRRSNLDQHRIADADHTFSSARAKESLARLCADWLARRMAPAQTAVDSQ